MNLASNTGILQHKEAHSLPSYAVDRAKGRTMRSSGLRDAFHLLVAFASRFKKISFQTSLLISA